MKLNSEEAKALIAQGWFYNGEQHALFLVKEDVILRKRLECEPINLNLLKRPLAENFLNEAFDRFGFFAVPVIAFGSVSLLLSIGLLVGVIARYISVGSVF